MRRVFDETYDRVDSEWLLTSLLVLAVTTSLTF